jgi:hypothetical protein
MLQMLKGLNTARYQPRAYFISEGDDLSAAKVTELEFGYRNHTVRLPVHEDMMLIL